MELAKKNRPYKVIRPKQLSPELFHADDPEFSWIAPEYEHFEKQPKWYWIMGSILLGIVVYALVSNAILMAITFILIGMLGYVYAERTPRQIRMEINFDGVVADKIMYEYDNLKSFWIFYEAEAGFKVLSIHSKKTFLPHIHLPIGKANPIEIRETLLHYLPEIRQEMTIIDRLSMLIGL